MTTDSDYSIQLGLFDREANQSKLDATRWHGSFNARESSLQQLSPYVGKMKTGMARELLALYSKPGNVVLDPFAGSGVVPFEAAILGRIAWANDLSPYAHTLTRGKLEAPSTKEIAVKNANKITDIAEDRAIYQDLDGVPEWVREFYDPNTLKETLVAFRLLKEQNDYFLMACLLGILHHVRPGFLSYPASHLVPYLRKSKYPPEKYPKMYQYRDLRSRLLAKVNRAYRHSMLPSNWDDRQYSVWRENAMQLPIRDETVDSIISSPPYFGALDYARDNRLRLWFLGCTDWHELDAALTANNKVYLQQMRACLKEMHRLLKPGGYCVLVLGDVERDGLTHRTAEILRDLSAEVTNGTFRTEAIYDDRIPDIRRSRRRTKTTKFERILVMQKD